MTAVCCSEAMFNFYLTARHHILEVRKYVQSVPILAERVTSIKSVLFLSNNLSSKHVSFRRSGRQHRRAKCPLLSSGFNENLNYLYSSSSIIRMIKSRRMRWPWHVALMGGKRTAYRISVGKPEWKILLGRARYRWVDNIKMNLREIWWVGMDWIDLTQDRSQWRALVITAMNPRVP
jgi:hypothetical protein